MAKHNDIKIDLKPFDDLFETDESRADLQKERLSDMPIKDIHDFPDHPYQLKDDEAMMELMESIKAYGLRHPVVVRTLEDGSFEMVSEHRRKRACELAGIETIPARIMELTRDEAILMMVDSNLQRDEILPSEKAKVYKMRLDAMKRQGQRTGLTFTPVVEKLSGKDILSPKRFTSAIVQKGEHGYFATDLIPESREEGKTLADSYNQNLGVTKRQAAAMVAGSMFGWKTPAADPNSYDENGASIRPKHRERDAR